MTQFQVTPFIPGIARGVLHRGSLDYTDENILLLTQPQLATVVARPAGIIVIEGAPFSHSMISLFGLGIPTVLVSGEIARELQEGADIGIDGSRGLIASAAVFNVEAAKQSEPFASAQPVMTTDGIGITLRASVSHVQGAALAARMGASAIGSMRTEFLIPKNGKLPDTGFFEEALGAVCQAADPLPVTVRLPDIAVDKPVPWYTQSAAMYRPLGLRGVRLYSSEPVLGVINSLVDAIVRLEKEYRLRLLLPYVVQLEEFSYWRSHIEQKIQKALPIGPMAETPAAVLELQRWFDVADFVAIGCNDLMQCLYAADRGLPELRHYLDPYAPVLYRFLQQAANDAGENIQRVQLCGLLSQLPGVLPVLIGTGFRVFSVEPIMVPFLSKVISETSVTQAQILARDVLSATNTQTVRNLLGAKEWL